MELDTKQLLRFSKHYLRLAKRLKLSRSDQSKTIGQLFNDYPSNRSSNVYLLMAHLASAAYRIGTIIDKHKALLINYNYHEKLKKTDKVNYETELRINLEQFLPLMLRDLVGHYLSATHKFACPRKNVIHKLTPSECLKIMGKTILALERDLIANQSKIKNRVLPGFNGV